MTATIKVHHCVGPSQSYPTEQAALDAAVAAGWRIEYDRFGTLSVYRTLSNRLADAGAQGWVWLIQETAPVEFWPWARIAPEHKRGEGDQREVLGQTFLGEPVWLPWMGRAER